MHQGQGRTVVVDHVLDRLAHETLGAFARDRLDADAGSAREADLLDAELGLQEFDQLLALFGSGCKFDAGIDVFGVFAEDDHIGLLGLTNRRRNALEVVHRAQADVEIELLAQSDVERTDATANGRGQRAFDRDDIILDGIERFGGQPHVRAVHLGRLLAGKDFHPVDLALAAIGLGHRGIDNLDHHGGDIGTCAIALDVGNDGFVRNIDRIVGVNCNFRARGRDLDMLVSHVCSGCFVRFSYSTSSVFQVARSAIDERANLSDQPYILYCTRVIRPMPD